MGSVVSGRRFPPLPDEAVDIVVVDDDIEDERIIFFGGALALLACVAGAGAAIPDLLFLKSFLLS